MKQRLSWGLALIALAPILNGCAPSASGPSFGNVGRNFAGDWTRARSFDRALIGLSRGTLEKRDLKTIEAVGRTLDVRIENGSDEGLAEAQNWIRARLSEAEASNVNAQYGDDSSKRPQWHAESDRAYRAALAFFPNNEKHWRKFGPQTLNALGYFLADRGSNHADFERAEKLTALSSQLSPSRTPAERFLRAQGPDDSHAWALFRLGRTKDALEAQAKVISILGKQSAIYGPPSAEILYHWGAMCRVAGHDDDAREAFKLAQKQDPSPELSEILEANLSGDLV